MNPPASAEGTGSILGSGRSPGEGNSNPFQYSCLGNPMDRGGWWATVRGVTGVTRDLVTKRQLIHCISLTALSGCSVHDFILNV